MAAFPPSQIKPWSCYHWIPIVGGILEFGLSCLVGANEVATSFGTSVGSGSLSMMQAIFLALLLEIVGSTCLGDRNIANMQFYTIVKENPPDVAASRLVMWAFFVTIIAALICLAIATYLGLPVSSSLPILGGILGTSFVLHGVDSVYWNHDKTTSNLHIGGVLAVFMSWIIAPLIAAVAAFIVFGITKIFILRSQKAEQKTIRIMPMYYGMTVMVLVFFIIYKASPRTNLHKYKPSKAAIIAGVSGLVASAISLVMVVSMRRKQLIGVKQDTSRAQPINGQVNIERELENGQKPEENKEPQPQAEVTVEDLIKQYNEKKVLETVYEVEEEVEDGDISPEPPIKCSPVCGSNNKPFGQLLATPNRHTNFKRIQTKRLSGGNKILGMFKKITSATIDHRIDYDRRTFVCSALAEKFSDEAEDLFSFLQVLTACVSSFSHGANEVASAAGPYAALLQIYQNRQLGSHKIDIWILATSSIGASIGFSLWGWKLTRCLGTRITFLSPSRGFSAQICAVATVLLATQTRLPVSTTHILIGAIVGVGIADNYENVNWKLLATFVGTWMMTLLFTSGVAAALYSFTIYSPAYSVQLPVQTP